MKRRTAEARQAEPEARVAPNGAAAVQGKNGEPLIGPGIADLGFWDQLHSLTDSQWQYHVVYLYRTEPPIRNGNDKNFIAKLTRPFDEADVLATHGSGKYLAILNNSRERRTIGKISFSCYHPDAPPKIGLAQLAPTADESWHTWLEEVESKRARAAAQLGTAQPEAPRLESDPATSEAIKQMGELSKQILARQARADDGGKEASPVLDPTLASLLAQMASGRDQLAEKLAGFSHGPAQADPITLLEKAATVILKLQPAAPPVTPTSDPLEQVRRTVEVVGLLRENFGNGAGGGESSATLETVMSNLPGILQAGSNLVGTVMNGIALVKAGPNIRSNGGPAPSQQTVTNAPTPAAVASATDATAKPVDARPDNPQPVSSDLIELAQAAIDALHRGIDGDSFADGLFLTRGALYLRRIQSMGVEGIMATLSVMPQLQAILPQIEAWVTDFCSYDPDEPEGEDVASQDDAAAREKPARKRTPKKANAVAS